MNGPDLELTHRFGNEDVLEQKLAGKGALATRLALGLLNYGMGRSELSTQQEQRRQADAMNEAFAQLRSMQMGPVEDGAHYTHPPIVLPAPVRGLNRWDGDSVPVGMDMGMVRMASVAAEVGSDMAKEALNLPGLLDIGKKALGALGGAVKPPSLAGATQAAAGAMKPVAGQGLGGLASGVFDQAKQLWQKSGITSMGGAARAAGGLALGAGALYAGRKALNSGIKTMSQEAQPAQYGSQNHGGSRVAYGVNEYGQPDLRTPFM